MLRHIIAKVGSQLRTSKVRTSALDISMVQVQEDAVITGPKIACSPQCCCFVKAVGGMETRGYCCKKDMTKGKCCCKNNVLLKVISKFKQREGR